jgi:type VI secretion system protein ImpB
MRAIRPHLQFYVENTLSEDDSLLDVELEFESMDDFSPGAIAKRVPQMQRLLEAREHLTELITYMDGKSSAEEVVKNLLEKPDFLHRLVMDARKTVADAEQDAQDTGNKGEA